MSEVMYRERDVVAIHQDLEAEIVTSRTDQDSNQENLHRSLVVDGGAAGLEFVARLGDRIGRRLLASVTLIDFTRTHPWKPFLHSVAAGSLNTVEYEVSYLAQAHWHPFCYRLDEMVGLDRVKSEHLAVTLEGEGRQIAHDTLIIAIGSVTNDFGTRGVAQYAVPLETAAQAERFNRRLVNACLRAQTEADSVRLGQLHVAIVGTSATGTELAAEFHRTLGDVIGYGLDRIDPERDVDIVLIYGSPPIPPGLPDRIPNATSHVLDEMGVKIRMGTRVTEVSADGVQLADGSFIPSDLIVCAVGVKSPDILQRLDRLETNRVNQLVVESTLQTTRDPDIFAIGDRAACPCPDACVSVPPRAQAGHQEASPMVGQMGRRLRDILQPYTYRDFGSQVSVGKWSTVGYLLGFLSGRRIFVEGLFARIMYRSLRLMHEQALDGSRRAVLAPIARGFAHRIAPPVKLH